MLIEDKGNQYLVTNKLTIAQMLKNGGIEIFEHFIDYAKDTIVDYAKDAISDVLPKEKKATRKKNK